MFAAGIFITPIIEIAIIAIILYYLLGVLWNTKALDLLAGLVLFVVLYGAANLLHLPVLRHLLLLFFNVAVLGFLILFQPELRMALSKVSIRNRPTILDSSLERYVDEITSAVYRMAEDHQGALIAFEQQDSLEEYTKGAVRLDAIFSAELLETIFEHRAPLHDGAVLIRGSQIVAAGAILPLATDSSQIARWMGTRHRAAVGISQVSDAIVVVVSEETGKVSIAREGLMTRALKPDRFQGILRSLFLPQKSRMIERLDWRSWLKPTDTSR